MCRSVGAAAREARRRLSSAHWSAPHRFRPRASSLQLLSSFRSDQRRSMAIPLTEITLRVNTLISKSVERTRGHAVSSTAPHAEHLEPSSPRGEALRARRSERKGGARRTHERVPRDVGSDHATGRKRRSEGPGRGPLTSAAPTRRRPPRPTHRTPTARGPGGPAGPARCARRGRGRAAGCGAPRRRSGWARRRWRSPPPGRWAGG